MTDFEDSEKEFKAPWKAWADKYKDSPRATFRDQIQFEMEVKAIYDSISKKGERVLDLGCGNGASFSMLLKLGLKPSAISGGDALDKFINIARKKIPHGDFFIMNLTSKDSICWEKIKDFRPTVVILKRVLCNLSGRKSQRLALARVCRCLPKSCKIIIIEPMQEGLQRLNILRYLFGLEALKEPMFNEYLRWEDIHYCLKKSSCINITKVDYSSTYYIGSRILQPFFWPDVEPDYNHPINKYFSKLPYREGFGLHWIIRAKKS